MQKFSVKVGDHILTDLRDRLAKTRWPDQVHGAGWDYGANLLYLQELVDHWLNKFDWRAQERRINELPQFCTTVDGIRIHYVHIRGSGPNAIPIIITHGWPSSFFEMHKIAHQLADPGGHGGNPADSFDVVIPSLPGFGFSERTLERGYVHVDRLWRKLMIDHLGYTQFVAHGTDIGARVTSALGRFHSDVVSAIHIGSVDLDWPNPLPNIDQLTNAEQEYIKRVARWESEQGAYAHIQRTFPQTVAYGLNDSPVGLAAWIVEKFRAWSDCDGDLESSFTKDELLTNIMIYWSTETINSSMRRYFESMHNPAPNPLKPGERITTPAAIAMFPGERDLLVPREWAERCYNVKRWTEMPRGGHFPAMEAPGSLIRDLREFFRDFRELARTR